MALTKAQTPHTQTVTLHLLEHYPGHEPREGDPHYKYFHQAHDRLKALGKLKCWICGTQENIELHHSTVEFSLANGVDVSRFEELYPEFGVTSDEEFLRWVEGEGNLTPLCRLHHTGILGVHVLPSPVWLPQRFWRAGLDAPAVVIPAGSGAKTGAKPAPAAIATPVKQLGIAQGGAK